MSTQFLGNIILKGKLECLTGMHIGGSKEKMEIGGVDSPVLRDPRTNFPYIPGSSLKGKMRTMLEFSIGKLKTDGKGNTGPCSCGKNDCIVCRLFGSSAESRNYGPTRLLVRDAHPDIETQNMWESLDSELLFTEYKPENTIDRLTSAANPRFMERVVKGSLFDVEFLFGVYRVNDEIKDEDYFKHVIESLKLLEHSAIGGSGSRGYGQVSFKFTEPLVVLREDYENGSQNFKDASKPHGDEIYNGKFVKRLSEFDDTYLNEILKKIS